MVSEENTMDLTNVASPSSVQEGDVHAKFSRMVESTERENEELMDMYKKERERGHFFISYEERLFKLNEANQAWVRFKMSEILYQAEIYEFNTQQSASSSNQYGYQNAASFNQ